MSWFLYLYFFFFEDEDGIRDWSVTGVQTCALPILFGTIARYRLKPGHSDAFLKEMSGFEDNPPEGWLYHTVFKSSKDQIGRASCRKEYRTRSTPQQEKKKKEDSSEESVE